MGYVLESPSDAIVPEQDDIWGSCRAISVKNSISAEQNLDFAGENGGDFVLPAHSYRTLNFDARPVPRIANEHGGWIQIKKDIAPSLQEAWDRVEPYWLLRKSI